MYKLVIVDDEKIIRETISSIIDWESLNIKIVGVCKDGIEAYDCIIDESPDIVMTDIRMPGISGIDLIQKLYSINSNIEYIIISGYNEFEYAKKAMEYGIKSYLLKPCSEDEIKNAVSKAVLSCQKKEQEILMENIAKIFSGEDCTQLLPICETILSRIDDIKLLKKILQGILLEANTSPVNTMSQIKIQEYLIAIKETVEINKLHALANDLFKELFIVKHSAKNGDCIEKVIDYVSLHISDSNLSLKWISENYLYMNADYVSRQFIKQTGEKFSQFLTSIRINEAKKMLSESPNEGIYEIAEKVGFGNNPQYFSQIFKKYTSMTPVAYQKALEEKKSIITTTQENPH